MKPRSSHSPSGSGRVSMRVSAAPLSTGRGSVRNKIRSSLIFVLFVGFIPIFILVYVTVSRSIRHQKVERLRTVNVAVEQETRSRQEYTSLAERLDREHELVVLIWDAKNSVPLFVHGDDVDDPARLATECGRDELTSVGSWKCVSEPEKNGIQYIAGYDNHFSKQTVSSVLVRIVPVVIGILIALLLLANYLSTLIARPIVLLAVESKRVFGFSGDEAITIPKSNDEIEYLAMVLEDARIEIKAKMFFDPLTGVYNRAYFNATLLPTLHAALRRKNNVAVVVFDIDHFKQVNDTHGHQAGDVVLQKTASLIQDQLRLSDMLVRFGGEEFVVVAEVSQGSDDVIAIAERIRAAIEATQVPVAEGKDLSVTVTAGIATIFSEQLVDVRDIESAERVYEEAFAQADRALYHGKESGRNRTVRYSQLPATN